MASFLGILTTVHLVVISYITCDVQIRGSKKFEYRIRNAKRYVKDLRISLDRRRDHIN